MTELFFTCVLSCIYCLLVHLMFYLKTIKILLFKIENCSSDSENQSYQIKQIVDKSSYALMANKQHGVLWSLLVTTADMMLAETKTLQWFIKSGQ